MDLLQTRRHQQFEFSFHLSRMYHIDNDKLKFNFKPGWFDEIIVDQAVVLWNKENVIYEKLLNDKLSTNLGYVYENVIAQMLKASGKNLFYHTIPYAEGKKYYEIDFLVTDKHKISPVEVKSSGYKTHKSLDVFCEKFSERVKSKYVIYTKDYKRENGVEYVPVYMTMFL